MNKNKLIIAIIVLIIDQITKLLTSLYKVKFCLINNFLSLNYYQNSGAAWSILEGKTSILIVSTIIALIIIYNVMFSYKENKINDLSFGLLFGGVVGNLFDRIFYGYVRDFIDISIFKYDFPVFNVADMAIVLGVIFLIFITIKGDVLDGRTKRLGSRKKN